MKTFKIAPEHGICHNLDALNFDGFFSNVALNGASEISKYIREKFPNYYSGYAVYPIGEGREAKEEYIEIDNVWDTKTCKYASWRIEIFKSILNDYYPFLEFFPDTLTVIKYENHL